MGVENTRLNSTVYIDYMYIEGAFVQHMVDYDTHLTTTKFVNPLKSEAVYKSSLVSWEAVLTGFPNTLVFDYGSQVQDKYHRNPQDP